MVSRRGRDLAWVHAVLNDRAADSANPRNDVAMNPHGRSRSAAGGWGMLGQPVARAVDARRASQRARQLDRGYSTLLRLLNIRAVRAPS